MHYALIKIKVMDSTIIKTNPNPNPRIFGIPGNSGPKLKI